MKVTYANPHHASACLQLKAAMDEAAQASNASIQHQQCINELQQQFHNTSMQQKEEINQLKSQCASLRVACGLHGGKGDNTASDKGDDDGFVVIRSSVQHLPSHLTHKRFATAGTQTRRKEAKTTAVQASIDDSSNTTALLSEQTQLVNVLELELAALQGRSAQTRKVAVVVLHRIFQRTMPSMLASAFMTWRCRVLRRRISQAERMLCKQEKEAVQTADSACQRITCYISGRMAVLQGQGRRSTIIRWQLGVLKQVGDL
jgi:hypothetical protein